MPFLYQKYLWCFLKKKLLDSIHCQTVGSSISIFKIKDRPKKDLKTILLGFNPNLINYQLQIINNLKNEFKKNKVRKSLNQFTEYFFDNEMQNRIHKLNAISTTWVKDVVMYHWLCLLRVLL